MSILVLGMPSWLREACRSHISRAQANTHVGVDYDNVGRVKHPTIPSHTAKGWNLCRLF